MTAKDAARYSGRLAPLIFNVIQNQDKIAGKTTDPKRFTDLDLAEREASYGRSGFALQFMLDTSLSDQDRYPLKLNDLIVMDCSPEMAPVKVVWAGGRDTVLEDLESVGFVGDKWHKPMWVSGEWDRYQGSVMFIDPSGRGKDETGYAVVNQLNGMLYLVDMGGFRDGYSPATLQSLAEVAKANRCRAIVIEDNFGDGMFSELFKPYLVRTYPVSIDKDFLKGKRSSTQKERRIIDTLEPVMNQHRLVISRRLIEKDMTNFNEHPGENWQKYQLFYQLTRLTKDKGSLLHDDRLDAVAGAVAYWVEEMNRDQEKVVEDHRASLLDEDLKVFMEHALGNSMETSIWW